MDNYIKEKPIDDNGLKVKYNVTKADTGEIVKDCFVLQPQKDRAARAALLTYSYATDNREMARDIARWLADITKREKGEE